MTFSVESMNIRYILSSEPKVIIMLEKCNFPVLQIIRHGQVVANIVINVHKISNLFMLKSICSRDSTIERPLFYILWCTSQKEVFRIG